MYLGQLDRESVSGRDNQGGWYEHGDMGEIAREGGNTNMK